MVLIVLMVLGLVAIKRMPVSLMPDVDIPQITVQISAADMSARELNDAVVTPMRNQLSQVSHLTDLHAEVKDGSGVITLVFEYGTDADMLFIEVNEKIDRSMGSLPDGADRPKVMKASATDIPAFYVNISQAAGSEARNASAMQDVELSRFVRHVVARRIEQLPQVAMVDLSGLVSEELLIIPDIEKLKAMGSSERTLNQAINAAQIRLGNLKIRDGEYQYNIRFESELITREDIENVYLKLDDRVFQIKDLAEVRQQPAVRQGMVTSDGTPAITLAVIKRSDAQMADLKQSMTRLMQSLRKDYPALRFTITRDQTELLSYSIHNMIQNILFGALFAMMIIFCFMQDFRSPLLVVLTIPTALIMSFLVFYIIGISINIISLSGLVLGLGMLVDNSIITTDNITQKWREGNNLPQACITGTRELFSPMLSSVLTTCAIFVPLIFLSGMAGAMFYDQAVSVTVTLFSALFVSVIVMPVYYARLYRRMPGFRPNPFIARMGLEEKMRRIYERILVRLLRHRGVVWGIFGCSAVGIAVLFAVIEKQRLPDMSSHDALFGIAWQERITAEENNRRCMEMMAASPDEVVQYTIMAGVQQFVLAHTQETAVSEATVYVDLADSKALASFERHVREFFRIRYPKATLTVKPSANLFNLLFSDTEAPLTARIHTVDGSTPDAIEIDRLLKALRKALPDTEIPSPTWEERQVLQARPEIMALYNISLGTLSDELKRMLNAGQLFSLTQGDQTIPVIMGIGRESLTDIIEGHSVSNGKTDIPLHVLLHEGRSFELQRITSGIDGEYLPVPMEVSSRQIPGIMARIKDELRKEAKYEASFSGSYFTSRQLVGELALILAVSILLLYFILAAQFESMLQPVIILSELLIDIFITLAVLWIAGISLNLMSMIGIVVMCGIVINDSILKVDTINRLRRSGMEIKRAVLEAGSRRFKAIVMTSLTTILALCPFLVRGDMGSDLQYPLSVALISGMIVGTVVSLFFVPVAYYVMYKRKQSV